MEPVIKTAQDVRNLKGTSVYEKIESAKAAYHPYPEALKKPFLKSNHSGDEAKEYSIALKKYEKEKPAYDRAKKEVQEYNQKINFAIEDFIKEESGLTKLPEHTQSKVYMKAYEDGHSNGYYSVYQELEELVDLFN